LRDLPDVTVRIGEGDRAHAPVTIRRATDQCHSVLVQLSAHRIDVFNPDGELPETLLRQGEYVESRGLVSRILPQRTIDQQFIPRGRPAQPSLPDSPGRFRPSTNPHHAGYLPPDTAISVWPLADPLLDWEVLT